ncbi:neural Wiskott-Aldrich syndrome protein-like [Lontra canadensis]|uniref:neural Wiskott-Aldrich syndrome protein-like n=1 Tax=Lontra canadensis TaxID=76717 RepID=UPI0013F2D92B|nr:neural Wiskott-Aldrich syndrome protein-like [Lontra canadensis]
MVLMPAPTRIGMVAGKWFSEATIQSLKNLDNIQQDFECVEMYTTEEKPKPSHLRRGCEDILSVPSKLSRRQRQLRLPSEEAEPRAPSGRAEKPGVGFPRQVWPPACLYPPSGPGRLGRLGAACSPCALPPAQAAWPRARQPEPQPPLVATSPDPALPGAQSQLRPPPTRTPVCLPARLPSPDFGAFSALGFGSRSPRSGGRAAAIGKQRRRPVAGACPSPHPAGNLGGALGVNPNIEYESSSGVSKNKNSSDLDMDSPDGKIFQENYYISQFNNHILSTHHCSHLIHLRPWD